MTWDELHREAAYLVEMAQTIENRAETFHRDTNRDKYHYLLGEAAGLRYASEALTELLTRPQAGNRLWSVKS